MQKSQVDATLLAAVTLAAALALTQISGPLAWLSSAGGFILLFIVLSFDQEGYRNPFQSLAFGGVCGLCSAVALGAVFQSLASGGEVHLGDGRWATVYMPLTCGFATALFWIIDLMRMNARKSAPIQVPRALGETRIFAEPAPVSIYQQQPHAAPIYQPPSQPVYRAPEPAAPPPAAARPEPEARRTGGTLFTTAPEPFTAPSEPAPAPAPVQPAHIPAEPLLHFPVEAPAPQPAPAAPPASVPFTGKETTIYVSLLGEGLNVLRSVRAEPLGHDFYRITEEMPANETWQFQPGQVVRCKKQKLSSGKAMVATEEAPRST